MSTEGAVNSSSEIASIDWNLCIFCQSKTSLDLECPAKSKKDDSGKGYLTLVNILNEFQNARALPNGFDHDILNADTLKEQSASWHKACRVQFNNTKLERARKRRDRGMKSDDGPSVVKHTRSSLGSKEVPSSSTTNVSPEKRCFFCEQDLTQAVKYKRVAATFALDKRVRQYATDLGDSRLLTKLAGGDMVATEAEYHANCLTSFYKLHLKYVERSSQTTTSNNIHGIVFAEVVAYIEEARYDDDKPMFKLADLVQLYNDRLRELGEDDKVHSSRLKEKILSQIPNLSAHTSVHSQGQNVIIMFDRDVADLVQEERMNRDYDMDAMYIAKAAEIVRLGMFRNSYSFDGSFSPDCQTNVIPTSLKALVDMILQGPSIKNQSAKTTTDQPALTISQMFMFNAVKHARTKCSNDMCSSGHIRHNVEREVPLPLYMGLKLHAVSRRKGLIDTMFQLGMSVCYDRVLQVITDLANGTSERFEAEGVVCPVNMKQGLFTVGALDNCDHNPTSSTAHDSFHGTSISLFQFPSADMPGIERAVVSLDHREPQTGRRRVMPLPEAYKDVPPAILRNKELQFAPSVIPVRPHEVAIPGAIAEEEEWLAHVERLRGKEKLDQHEYVSWAGFHASRQQQEPHAVALNALMPLFYENAHTVAMVKHGMGVIKKAIHHVNPGQIPVMAVDQPLYALAKQIQMNWPDTHGEDKCFVILGGLHIEMATLRALGIWLQDSGWVPALVQAEIATPGTAESFIKVAHVTKTRHVHQITAASLSILRHKAYQAYLTNLQSDEPGLAFDVWQQKRIAESPLFQYWSLTLKLQLILLMFLRAQRDGNFVLYVESLDKLAPWFFAFDQINYARWLPVNIRDLNMLAQVHPELHQEFQAGNFVIHKTPNVSSGMSIDQAHEQNNDMVKGSGGAVGLTESPSAFTRWMVAGPELSRTLTEFESTFKTNRGESAIRHHEQVPAVQSAFAKQVNALVSTIEEMGNPFLDESADLLVLDSKEILDDTVVRTVRNIETIGAHLHSEYVEQRLVKATTAISHPLPKQQLPLFSKRGTKVRSRSQLEVADLKVDRDLMSRLYISCQSRAMNLDDFFMHENHPYPPSLSDHGKLRTNSKSDLVDCLEDFTTPVPDPPAVDAIILDGAAVVHLLDPRTARTFKDYADTVFLPYIDTQLQRHEAQRIDLVWDTYIPDSLKSSTRQRRGKGIRRRVLGKTNVPSNWKEFLRVDENKVELFEFLTNEVMKRSHAKWVYATDKESVLCSHQDADTDFISPCNHEEADTRVIIHAFDAARKGSQKLLIRTVDTDILVLAIAYVERLGVQELWVAFGTGKKFRYLAAHEISQALGSAKSRALPMFHSFTGCDTVSAFAGKGKKTAWAVWRVYPKITESFNDMSVNTDTIGPENAAIIERFSVLLYDRTTQLVNINSVRKELFTRKGTFAHENLPPTKAALEEHTKRAMYQGGHVWGQSMCPQMRLPTPEEWGWSKTDDGWKPKWTVLPEASRACRELIKCGCKKDCAPSRRCGCHRANMTCTTLCTCVCMNA